MNDLYDHLTTVLRCIPLSGALAAVPLHSDRAGVR